MNYIVTKSPKSKGIAILLVLLFGSLGLFYSSIRAGIIMTVIPFIAGLIMIISFLSGNIYLFLGIYTTTIIFFLIFYWIICLIWAINAVNAYNKKLYAQSQTNNTTLTNENSTQNSYAKKTYNYDEKDKPDYGFIIHIIIGVLILTAIVLMYDSTDKSFNFTNLIEFFK